MRSTRLTAGLSLVEALIAMVVLSTAAIMYSSVWKSQVGANESGRQLETATLLYLRQVELLRSLSIRTTGCGGVPFSAPNFQFAVPCAPPDAGGGPLGATYGGGGDLEPAVMQNTLLTSGNSYGFPADDPRYIVCAPTADPCTTRARSPELYGEGFRVRVRARRVYTRFPTPYDPNLEPNMMHLLVKYAIRVNRVNEAGTELDILTGEILQEVR